MRNLIQAIMIPAICFTLAADTTGRVSGKVSTKDGKPVTGAIVLMSRVDINWTKEIKANDKGYFMQVGLEAKDFKMTVSAPGFQPFSETVKVPLGETLVKNVTLLTPQEASAEAIQKGLATMSAGDAKAVSGTAAFNGAIELYNHQRFAEALPLIEKAVNEFKEAKASTREGEAKKATDDQIPVAERIYGICLYEAGKADPQKKDLLAKAEPYLTAAYAANPKDQRLLVALLDLSKAKNDPAATKTYQDALDAILGPRPELAYNDGVTAFNEGRFKEAKESVTKAIKLDPKFPDSYWLLGVVEYSLNDIKGAKEAFKTYLGIAPTGKKADEVKMYLKELGK